MCLDGHIRTNDQAVLYNLAIARHNSWMHSAKRHMKTVPPDSTVPATLHAKGGNHGPLRPAHQVRNVITYPRLCLGHLSYNPTTR
jgi:hypothetical protein